MPDDAPRYKVTADREAALNYCAQHDVVIGDASSIRGICQWRDDEIVAATLYQDFNGSNVWCHIVGQPGRRWLTRQYLHNIFAYPFVTLQAKRISLWVEESNAASHRFVKHLGFNLESIMLKAGRGGASVFVYVMFREECRYA